MAHDKDSSHSRITAAGLLVTLGIIYGDIGTSPLYVMKAIVGGVPIAADVVKGGLSCIFWTLTLQTTIKYVMITLQADNKGEGGTFALYALVRRTKKRWLIVPAMIGGSALLADGIITPSISVSSAVEGLRLVTDYINTVPIVLVIVVALFFVQQFGTKFIGKGFGPVMLIWFLMLGVLGMMELAHNPGVLAAMNPYYAYKFLADHPGGFWLLGAVFLCTTGAEALYSDLGHCGKKNIRVSWIFVKICLLLNYFGQGAWLVANEGKSLADFAGGGNPFFTIMPQGFLFTGIIVATAAAVIASQAMISGSFTLINEAMRLNLWPKVRIKYPTNMKGQIYIPSINWLLMTGCICIVLYFRESSSMEAAYGLAIILTMFMTTILLSNFLVLKRVAAPLIYLLLVVYMIIEGSFLVANLEKLPHGGWITLLIASGLASVMFCWFKAKEIRNRYTDFVKLSDYLPLLTDLSKDMSVPKYATHLVYLTAAAQNDEIEKGVIYSILQKQPKRADIYWFVHVDVVDEPYTMNYKVSDIAHHDVVRIDFRLGFRVAPKINLMFRKVVEDMVKNKEVDITSRYESLNRQNVIGDFRFVLLEKFLSSDNELPFFDRAVLDVYSFLRHSSLSEEKGFGLDTSNVMIEKVPLVIAPVREMNLKRI